MSNIASVNFEAINTAALSGYAGRLRGWFPGGAQRGNEFVVGDLSGAKGESLSVNTRTGKWADFSGAGTGGDPISLYAAAFHGGSQIEGAKALARELGMDADGPDVRRIAPVITAPAPSEPTEIWEPSRPPADAPDPPLRGDHVWTYRDATGFRLGYVVRRDAGAARKKTIWGVNWGRRRWTDDKGFHDVTGWHNKHSGEPMTLYGLELLAERPTAPVIVTEGEKACDAARAMFPDHVCVTWPRGTKNVTHCDWTPLAGRWVAIWPDNDKPGLVAAAQIEGILHAITADVITLRVDDLPEAADAADVTVDDPGAWLAARSPRPAPPPPSEEPPPAEYIDPGHDAGDEYAQAADQVQEGVLPLGHDRGVYFYYSQAARQVIELTPDRHSRAGLCSMASGVHHWERQGHLRMDKGGVDWAKAADWLMDLCRRQGIFNPDRVRGRGAWLDGDRAVLNLGDCLNVDGHFVPLLLPGSLFIYEAGNSFSNVNASPLPVSEANKLVTVCESLRWEKPINARLFAGFIAIAPICGALKWRPSVWITGGAGSGKSFAVNSVMKKAIGKLALHVKSSTSSAGIRAELGRDARPVIFDEAEAETRAGAVRMAETLELVRQSSSADDGEIIKGTQTQKSKKFRIQSCFAFQSINVSIEHAADESRITVLGLREPGKGNDADAAKFVTIEALVADTFTPEFSAGLLARSTSLVHVIRANAETFARAISQTVGSRRTGDQLGALLAGAYSLHSNKEITLESAIAYVSEKEWVAGNEAMRERDERKALQHLLTSRLKVGVEDIPIQRLIDSAIATGQTDGLIDRTLANQTLGEAGLGVAARSRKDDTIGLFVANKHKDLGRIFYSTPWAMSWGPSMARLPGAETGEGVVKRFGGNLLMKATFVPLAAFNQTEGDATD